MNFSELKTELGERGVSRLGDTRLGTLINRAVRQVDSLERWPYREASVTGTAPLAIPDLAFVDVVFNTDGADSPVPMVAYGRLVAAYGDLSAVGGAPSSWYLAYPSGVPTVATFPVTAATIGVQYYRTTPTLAADEDVPLAPDAYHGIYVDKAQQLALMAKGDWEGATAVAALAEEPLAGMRLDLLFRQASGPSQVLASDGGDF